MERHTGEVDTCTACCIQNTAVAGRVVSGISDKDESFPHWY